MKNYIPFILLYLLLLPSCNLNGENWPRPVVDFTPRTPPTGWPNETDTGIQVDYSLLSEDVSGLTETGSGYIVTDGMTVENLILRRRLIINGDNITIRNCRLYGDPTNHGYGIELNYGTNVLIENNTIGTDASSWPNGQKGIMVRESDNVEIRGNYIRHVADGIFIANSILSAVNTDLTIVDNYIVYVQSWSEGSSPDSVHNRKGDGIEGLGPSDGLLISHNSIEAPGDQTSCMIISPQWGPLEGLDISDNWMNGAGYALRLRDSDFSFTNFTAVSGNVMGPGSTFGPFDCDIEDSILNLSDNTWETNGLEVEGMNRP